VLRQWCQNKASKIMIGIGTPNSQRAAGFKLELQPFDRRARAGHRGRVGQVALSVRERERSRSAGDERRRREGSGAPLRSRFARVRMRIAPSSGAAGRTEETLLIEWPTGEAVPTKYWLSNLDHRMSFRRLVDIAKMRAADRSFCRQQGRREINAAFREHGAMAFSMRAAVIRIVRAISRRTPNADEGHLRLRRRLTEQARCAIKIPRGSVVWPRAWRGTIDIKPGRKYPRSSPTSQATAYN
jgi:hypothetical protein